MARLRDVPLVCRKVGFRRFALRVWDQVVEDHVFIFAAAVAYAWLFAIFPFFVFLANLAGVLLAGDAQGQRVIGWVVEHALPLPIVELFRAHPVLTSPTPRSFGGMVAVTLLVALWAASNGMSVTMAVLDKCYEIDRPRIYYKRRPMAFLLTLACAALLLLVMLLLPVGKAFGDWYVAGSAGRSKYDAVMIAFDALRVALAVGVVFLILALIYHFGPCVKHRWRWVTPGAVFALVGWIVLGAGFNLYCHLYAAKGYGRTFGPAGGVALMLLLFYLDALVLMIGAEINSEVDFEVLSVKRGTRDFLRAEVTNAPVGNAGAASPPAVSLDAPE